MNDDLHFVKEAVREKRTNRAVNEAARERFLFARAAFTLEEPAGELTGGVGLFDVVNGEREEVLAGLGFLLGDNGGKHHGVVHGADHSTGGLTGDFPRGKRHIVIAELKALRDFIKHRHDEMRSLKVPV